MTKLPSHSRIPKVKAHGGASRRRHYSDSTKLALIDVAEELFTEHGYSATSLDAIVSGAKVTKGALYHHFSGKQAVFEAVFERIDARACAAIQEQSAIGRDPWEMAQGGLHAFLEVVQQPSYRRVVIQDGPSVLGYERFREQEGRSTFANVFDIVRTVLSEGDWDVDDAMIDTFTHVFFGALSAAGGSVALSADPRASAARVEAAVTFILAGLQSLIASGVAPPSSADVVLDADGR